MRIFVVDFQFIKNKMTRGKLIVIEGTDGTGKSTQADLLIRRMESGGYKVKLLDFPQYGKNPFADTVAGYLKNEYGQALMLNPYLSSLPYAADRWKASLDFRKDMDQGINVISNRYTSASMGHQGSKLEGKEELGKFIDWLKMVEFSDQGFGIPKPDLTILLYLQPEIAQRLIEKKAERVYLKGSGKMDAHESSLYHLHRASQTFLDIADKEGWALIDCTDRKNHWILPVEQIHELIWDTVKRILGSEA